MLTDRGRRSCGAVEIDVDVRSDIGKGGCAMLLAQLVLNMTIIMLSSLSLYAASRMLN